MTTVPKWAPYTLVCITGYCLIKTAGIAPHWWALVTYIVWCAASWATVSAVVDHMRIQHQAAIWKGLPR